MTTVGSSAAETFLGALTVILLVGTYGHWLYRRERLRRWQERLRARVAVVRELIADGERTKTAYAGSSDPSSTHESAVTRLCGNSSAIRSQGGSTPIQGSSGFNQRL